MILKESLRGEKHSEQMKQSEKSCEEENKTKETDTHTHKIMKTKEEQRRKKSLRLRKENFMSFL